MPGVVHDNNYKKTYAKSEQIFKYSPSEFLLETSETSLVTESSLKDPGKRRSNPSEAQRPSDPRCALRESPPDVIEVVKFSPVHRDRVLRGDWVLVGPPVTLAETGWGWGLWRRIVEKRETNEVLCLKLNKIRRKCDKGG